MIIQGNCLEKLKDLKDNSVDSIVTDPPYELGFMGKHWDNTGIAYNKDMWAECLRVLKPGGHILAFSGTRTYHRMAVAIEDAGFEIRDMVEWVYGSGFPKSLNIGKAVDKIQGNERELIGTVRGVRGADGTGHENAMPGKATGVKQVSVDLPLTKGNSEWEGWGTALKPAHEPICLARKPIEGTVANNVLKYGTGGLNIDKSRVDYQNNDDSNATLRANTKGAGRYNKTDNINIDLPPVNQDYDPSKGRFPANFLHDGSDEVVREFPNTSKSSGGNTGVLNNAIYGKFASEKNNDGCGFGDSGSAARFFKNFKSSEAGVDFTLQKSPQSGETFAANNDIIAEKVGNSKSFLYCPKASKSERDRGCEGMELKVGGGMAGTADQTLLTGSGNIRNNMLRNNHPTVKPLALMKYLIQMITPEGGVVLDPFAGSGSTLVAAKELGYDFIGIEMTEEYIPIIEARLKGAIVEKQMELL